MTRLRPRPALDVRVEIRGELPREDAGYARARAQDTAPALGPDAHALRLRLTLAQADVEPDGTGPARSRRDDGHYGLITPVADGRRGAGIPPARD
ncbi:hypothetical protein [Streptomyces sp. CBMA123]|uniref:hypothetical protein n=1 Tax=Streptomyces sp. CBMA123 TaxID=1896313 RepID=UPI001661DFB8|nr:hypothetical protein [Streptomyces sp. CBMA123]MBD0692824.1 hypothetical protein [Streptomyces sp. CBMA123]